MEDTMSSKSAHGEASLRESVPLVEQGTAFMELEGREIGASNRSSRTSPERFDVVVIGGGQAGLSTGYHLKRRGVNFVILEANARIGEQWRRRWDSLHLFTPARFSGLDGMPFPAPVHSFPSKDEFADYLEAYARKFQLPVRTGVRVERLQREGGRYVISAGGKRYEAGQVIIAAASYQKPRIPGFADELDPGITQFHSSAYRNPAQLTAGSVLLVGAGNSASEIARELAPRHKVWMSGRDVGHIPFRIEGFAARLLLVRLVLRGLFHRVLTIRTPMGKKVRPMAIAHGGPLIRVKPRDLAALGVERMPRVKGVQGGRPVLEDGRALNADNVIWCTGFHPGLSWIDLPIFEENGEPRHERGIVPNEPGLYFVGLHFLYSLSSAMIHGVGRDARHMANMAANKVMA
jgi:putative flavoprotein involved in K+ transport